VTTSNDLVVVKVDELMAGALDKNKLLLK